MFVTVRWRWGGINYGAYLLTCRDGSKSNGKDLPLHCIGRDKELTPPERIIISRKNYLD
jgi:hypothetical protein